MTKEDFFEIITRNLPVTRKSDDFLADVSAVYDCFVSNVYEIEIDAFGGEDVKNSTLQIIEEQIATIKDVLSTYLGGCHGEAFQKLKTHLINNGEKSLDLKVITIRKTQESGCYYYRARKNDGTIKSFKNMFHIPNNQREIVKTERFSVPGYPCLYLGNTVFDCWEEMGRPSFEELFFSGYKVVNEFKVYDLRKPTKEELDKEQLSKTLERLVLVIACQFIVRKKDAPFKPEYIIPQLVMEIIVSMNRKQLIDERGPFHLVWGVVFTSTCLSSDFEYQEDYLENIVIPVVDTKNEHCGYLASLFEVSEPLCYRYEELKEMQNGLLWETIDDVQKDEIKQEYELTKMGFLERRLKQNAKYGQLEHVVLDCPQVVKIGPEGGSFEVPLYAGGSWNLEVSDFKEKNLNEPK